MTPEERRAYVRGVLTTCSEFKVSEDVMAKVCMDLGIDPGELEDLGQELSSAKARKKEKVI
jgi:hypothetical protein